MTLVQPSPEMSILIRKELNENVDTRESDLQHIKDWLEKQPHLPNTWDEPRLMTFLRGCKFSLEKCKRKLDMYFTMRTAIPEFFTNRDITSPELSDILNYIHIPPLPGLTPNGRRVIVMRALQTELTVSVSELLKLALMFGDLRLAEESVGVAGDVYVFDASHVTASHLAKFTPTVVKKFLICVQEAYPVKLKEIHIINISPIVDTIHNFVKPFLKEKIRNRIFIHSNLESLYKHVPQEMLPEEYGGNAGSIVDLNNAWKGKLESYKGWFKEQDNIKSDEARRPGKPKTHDDLFGMDGSFRKLTID